MTITNLSPDRRVLWTGGAVYLAAMLAVVAFGALVFRGLYTPNLRPELRVVYGAFLSASGFGLALLLGIWAGVFGYVRGKLWHGLAVLVAGGLVTGMAFSLLPWAYFPRDQYAAAAVWLMAAVIPAGVSWLVIATVGSLMARYRPGPSHVRG